MNFRELLKAKIEEQAALVNAAKEAGRALTDEEQGQFDALEKEILALEKSLEAQKKAEERIKALETPVNTPVYVEPKNRKPKTRLFLSGSR